MNKERINRMLKVCLAGIFSILMFAPATVQANEIGCLGDLIVEVKWSDKSLKLTEKEAAEKITTEFKLEPLSENARVPGESEATLKGTGKKVFGAIKFNKPDNYYYTLTTKVKADKNAKLDIKESYVVRFFVYYNDDGKLQADVFAYDTLSNAEKGEKTGKSNLIFDLTYKKPTTNTVNTSTYINNNQWLYLAAGSLIAAILIGWKLKIKE